MPTLRNLEKAGIYSLLTVFLAVPWIGNAQNSAPTTSDRVENPSGESATVIHLAGLPDVKADAKGTLTLTPDALVFNTGNAPALIAANRIVTVSTGDERVERGGTAGKMSRLLPFGVGPALGVVSQKSVDLLTVEYRDVHEGYHAAVFMLPTKQAAEIQQKILAETTPLPTVQPAACRDVAGTQDSVLLASVDVSGMVLPAEYRALFYEQLLADLQRTRPSDSWFRAGDTSAGPECTALTLRITLVGFKKGNRALRASTGPLGMFLGTTKISFAAELDDRSGKVIWTANLKQSKRGDSDSMNVTQNIANAISKRIGKVMDKTSPSSLKLI
jgi:hypothetical protein